MQPTHSVAAQPAVSPVNVPAAPSPAVSPVNVPAAPSWVASHPGLLNRPMSLQAATEGPLSALFSSAAGRLLQRHPPRPARPPLRRVCVYCGSSAGKDPAYAQQAAALGTLLAQQGLQVVYGGSNSGLMGAVANAAMAGGGYVTGVVPVGGGLAGREVRHSALNRTILVDTLANRKDMLAHLADAFVVLPGGLGTLDELFQTLCAAARGTHSKPIGFLNVNGYYTQLLNYLGTLAQNGFTDPEDSKLYCSASTADELLKALRAM